MGDSCRRLEYTDQSLLDFKRKMEQQLKEEQLAKAGGGDGGFFGGFHGGGGEDVQEKMVEADEVWLGSNLFTPSSFSY